MKIETAPPVAICATCNCLCSNERVTVGLEYDTIARRELPVFRHATAHQCQIARARSAAFWTGAQEHAHAA